MPFLRDSAGLGQALAYIRPLQKDLDTSALQSDEQVCSFEWLIFFCLTNLRPELVKAVGEVGEVGEVGGGGCGNS